MRTAVSIVGAVAREARGAVDPSYRADVEVEIGRESPVQADLLRAEVRTMPRVAEIGERELHRALDLVGVRAGEQHPGHVRLDHANRLDRVRIGLRSQQAAQRGRQRGVVRLWFGRRQEWAPWARSYVQDAARIRTPANPRGWRPAARCTPAVTTFLDLEEHLMSLLRWEPFRDTDEYFRRAWPGQAGRPLRAAESAAASGAVHWTPSADISESEQEFLVRAELPGVRKEDVRITVEQGTITIAGERRLEKEDQGTQVPSHRVVPRHVFAQLRAARHGRRRRDSRRSEGWRAARAPAQEGDREAAPGRDPGRLGMVAAASRALPGRRMAERLPRAGAGPLAGLV